VSNYVDPEATRPVELGPCRCPGTPHTIDMADVVAKFSYAQLGLIYQAGRSGGIEYSYQVAILLGVKRWNLTLPDGSAREIDSVQVGRLDKTDVDRFMADDILGPAFKADPLPKASSGRSRSGSPASTTSTPTTTTPSPSTTG
jgi:hypothetical protein